MKSLLSVLLIIFIFSVTRASENCYTIIAGKKTTSGGNVIIGHNEDDRGKNFFVEVHKIGSSGEKGRTVKLKNGRSLTVPNGSGYLWLQIPGTEFGDSYVNEHGVVIVSNACMSKEDSPVLTEGGIGRALRHLVAEQAVSARDAVRIAGRLIDRFGYSSSGRNYAFADANEGWFMHIVMGKHWVAQRVPDHSIAIIPNYYTIGEIDLNDRDHFMGSPDIIEYAVKRGWYIPGKGKKFSFREAYSDEKNRLSRLNTLRHWRGVVLFSRLKLKPENVLPFSFEPSKRVKVQDIFSLMRDHYEGTEFDLTDNYKAGSPNSTNNRTICTESTRYSLVAELRTDVPDEIAPLIWIAFRRPDSNAFSPWYPSISSAPDGYTRGDPAAAFSTHMKKDEGYFKYDDNHAYWSYAKLSEKVDGNYRTNINKAKKVWGNFENSIQKEVKKKEREFIYLLGKNKAIAVNMITNYIHLLEYRKWINAIDLFNTIH